MSSRWLVPLVLFLACVVLPGACTCAPESPPAVRGLIACRPQHPTRTTVSAAASAVEMVAAGAAPVTFSVTSAGEAMVAMPLRTVPGRGVEPQVALTFSSSGGDGVLGVGSRGPSGGRAPPRSSGPRETALDPESLANTDAAIDDPELEHMRELYRGEFKQAFAEALASLSYADRLLLHRRFEGRRSLDELAGRLKLNEVELASVLRLIRSQLDVTLGRLLDGKPGEGEA